MAPIMSALQIETLEPEEEYSQGQLKTEIPTYHLSPKFIPPKHRGLTRTAAVGDSNRCRPRPLLGSGGIVMKLIVIVVDSGEGGLLGQ